MALLQIHPTDNVAVLLDPICSGETLEVAVELEDALIDAGYEIRIDSAVEDKRDNRAEIRLPLTAQPGEASGGAQGYVERFGYQL